MDENTLEQLTNYTKRARNILEEMESILKDTTKIPMKRTPRETPREIIIDLRKKLNYAGEISKDTKLFFIISSNKSQQNAVMLSNDRFKTYKTRFYQ